MCLTFLKVKNANEDLIKNFFLNQHYHLPRQELDTPMRSNYITLVEEFPPCVYKNRHRNRMQYEFFASSTIK